MGWHPTRRVFAWKQGLVTTVSNNYLVGFFLVLQIICVLDVCGLGALTSLELKIYHLYYLHVFKLGVVNLRLIKVMFLQEKGNNYLGPGTVL